MKRFTETEKWRDPWFQKLDGRSRFLWLWLCDRVDNGGVIDICWPICNAETGETFMEADLAFLGDRVERLPNGKWWIPGFVNFQFGELSNASKVHQSVEKILLRHSLSDRVPHRLWDSPKEKEEDKEKEKESEGRGVSRNGRDDIKTRLNRLFSRRDSTAWSEKEERKLSELLRRPEFGEELIEIEKRYTSGTSYLRQDIQTLLNNWTGELDRARKPEQKASSPQLNTIPQCESVIRLAKLKRDTCFEYHEGVKRVAPAKIEEYRALKAKIEEVEKKILELSK